MRVSDTARRGVVFLGTRQEDGSVHYGGTGFLVHLVEQGVNVCYLVTARHVAERLNDKFVVRANLWNSGSEELSYPNPVWAFPEDQTIDLAATLCVLPSNRFENTFFRINDGIAPEEEIACGDPISIIGLFRLHKGASRNIPVVHSGHVAALPDPQERIPVRDARGQIIEVSAYLVEAQTLDGLSGAPVWISRFAKVPGISTMFPNPPQIIAGMSLLGVYQASWQGAPDDTLGAERKLVSGTRVPVGFGLVVPAKEIVKLIETNQALAPLKAAYIKEALETHTSLSDYKPKN